MRTVRTRTCTLLAVGLAFLESLPPVYASSNATTAVLDSGGKRVNSANYSIDGSIGSLGGSAAAASPQAVARYGYAGQLYDVQGLAIHASPATINETSTSRLSANAILDDSTLLSLSAADATWGVVSGPIASISATGLATASNVHQDTTATVHAGYQSASSTMVLTVLNTGNDDLGLYAHDGMDDAWQVRHFGMNNPAASPNANPDNDGADNLREYVADTNPTNSKSIFQILDITNHSAFSLFFQSSANRNYTLYVTTNLTSGAWTNISSQTGIPGSGTLDMLADPAPATARRSYRIGVRLP